MEVNIVLYGIAKDIVGASKYAYSTKEELTVSSLLKELKIKFPKLEQLTSLLIAVNDEYAEMGYVIKNNDEVVLVPPVSGG